MPLSSHDTANLKCFLSKQLHETTRVEEVEARRCKARLEHLVVIGLPQKDEATKWNDKRMDRILADYMLRRGYHRSATQLARERQIEVFSPHGSAKADACCTSITEPKTACSQYMSHSGLDPRSIALP